MRDYSNNVSNEEDFDERIESPDDPSLHNNSFTSSSWNVPQGSYVMAFDMTALEERAAIDMAQRKLSQLQGECECSSEGWRRIRGKKGSSVKLWEKGCPSALTTTQLTGSHKSRRKSLPLDRSSFLSASSVLASEGAALHATYAVRSSITIHSPIETVLKVLDCSLATSYRSFTKIMYEQLVMDTSVLFHSSHRTNRSVVDDTIAVRWLAMKCQNPLTSDCDFCLVEYTKIHSIDELAAMQQDEKKMYRRTNQETAESHSEFLPDGLHDRFEVPSAYKIIRSMETKYCPELQSSHHLARTHVPLGGYLLYETDHCDKTDVVFYMSYESNQSMSDYKNSRGGFRWSSDDRQVRAIQQVMQQMALGIGRIRNALDAHAMSLRLETLRTTKWIDNSERMGCIVCYRRFHPLARRRHHCRLCGEVICRNCSVIKDADLPTVGPTTLRICMFCDADHFDQTSSLAAIQRTPVKKSKIKNAMDAATRLRREALLETTTMQSPIMTRQKRHNSLFIDNRRHSMSNTVNSSENKCPIVPRNRTPTSIHHLNVAETEDSKQSMVLPTQRQPMSCPKPSAQEQSQTFAEKWKAQARQSIISPASSPSTRTAYHGKEFAMVRERATSMTSGQYQVAMSPTTSNSGTKFGEGLEIHPLSPISSAASCSKAATIAALNIGYPRKMSQTAVSSPSAKQTPSSPVWIATPTRGYASSPVAQSPSRSRFVIDNQRSSSKVPRFRTIKLENVALYEEKVRTLCVQAIAAFHTKFAAISLYVSDQSNITESEVNEMSMVHYMVVDGAPTKLLPISAKMKCCAPILDILRPIAIRDMQTDGLDYLKKNSLPIIKGPQQTRFYAGVPLIDSTECVFGAIAVFDPQTRDHTDNKELFERNTVATFRQVVERAMPIFEEKHLNEPSIVHATSLLRSSELELKLTRPHASSPSQQYIFNDNQSPNQVREQREFDDADLNEEDLRSLSLYTPQQLPQYVSKQDTSEYYKHQMSRLVQQAQRTHDQMLQNNKSMHMQGVM